MLLLTHCQEVSVCLCFDANFIFLLFLEKQEVLVAERSKAPD